MGCRPPPPAIDPGAPLPAPTEVLARLEARAQQRTSIRALGRATYFGPQGRVRLKMVVAAARPESVRIETLSPLEQPIDVMVSSGKRMWLLSDGHLREGPATPENVGRILPFPMAVPALVDTLLGGVPLDTFDARSVALNDEGAYVIELIERAGAGQTLRVAVDPSSLAVLSVDSGSMKIAFEDLEEIPPATGLFPRKIRVAVAARDLDVRIQFQEVELNVLLDAQLFTITPPPGVIPELLPSPPVVLPSTRGSTVAGWRSEAQAE